MQLRWNTDKQCWRLYIMDQASWGSVRLYSVTRGTSYFGRCWFRKSCSLFPLTAWCDSQLLDPHETLPIKYINCEKTLFFRKKLKVQTFGLTPSISVQKHAGRWESRAKTLNRTGLTQNTLYNTHDADTHVPSGLCSFAFSSNSQC